MRHSQLYHIGAGDIQANLQTLKSLNYNIINPDPPYPNISFVHQMFQAADTIGGIYIQYSFRHDYTDIQKIIDQVNQFKDYSSLLTWYIVSIAIRISKFYAWFAPKSCQFKADEPDGPQWTNTSAVFDAYEVIKRSDPYHPVALVLNCEHSAAFYADATDILTTGKCSRILLKYWFITRKNHQQYFIRCLPGWRRHVSLHGI